MPLGAATGVPRLWTPIGPASRVRRGGSRASGDLELISLPPGWEDRAVTRWRAARRARWVRVAFGVAAVAAAGVAIAVAVVVTR
jgi:hypothetical protein